MSMETQSPHSSGYTFGRDFPVDEIEGGTSVLIKGSSKPGRKDFVYDLLASDSGEVLDPAVLVTTNEAGVDVAQRYRSRVSGYGEHPPLGIIDCMPNSPSCSLEGGVVSQVSAPGSLTGIGVEITKIIDLLDSRGYGRARLVLDSISPIAMYTEPEVLFRFLQTVISYIQKTGSLGVFAIDPDSHDEQELSVITHLFNHILSVEEYRGFGISDSVGFD